MASQVQTILKQKGIEHHLTMPGSPQSNRKAKCHGCSVLRLFLEVIIIRCDKKARDRGIVHMIATRIYIT